MVSQRLSAFSPIGLTLSTDSLSCIIVLWYDSAMPHKWVISFLIVICIPSLAFASFVLDDWNGHPEIVGGVLPTYIHSGFAFGDISGLAGVGYTQRKIWQNPVTGVILTDDPLVYDVLGFDWALSLSHDFGPFSGSLGYMGSYEQSFDSMIAGSTRQNGSTTYTVDPISTWFTSLGTTAKASPYYGDLSGLGTTFFAKLGFGLGPFTFATELVLGLWYYRIEANATFSKPLIAFQGSKELNLYEIQLVDNFSVDYAGGSFVPFSVQGVSSLGSKVRGYNSWTYTTAFNAVNNLDLRFNGPEVFWKGIFPRMIAFFDIGFGVGDYYNTSIAAGPTFLSSIGFQLSSSLTSHADIGYQIAYLMSGHNYTQYGSPIVGEITIKLRF